VIRCKASRLAGALAELGKAIKATFLCQYLNTMELRQEINEGLNVIWNWNWRQ
jgi:TnpA family transposase